MTKFFILLILIYQRLISPMLPRHCRFYPTCSEYSVLALKKYGLIKGMWLAFKRIIKCHPFSRGGYDPI